MLSNKKIVVQSVQVYGLAMPLQQIYPSGYCCVVTVKDVFNIPELLTIFSTSEGCRTKGQILEGE